MAEAKPKRGTSHDEANKFIPGRGELKYLAFKMVAMSKHKHIRLIVERAKAKYLHDLGVINTTTDPILPPCVGCPSACVYYCGHFGLECRIFVQYSNGKNGNRPVASK